MPKPPSLEVIDLEVLDGVWGGRIRVEERPRPGGFNLLGDWVPGRHNMALDGLDFGANTAPSGLGHPNTAEGHADGLAADFLRANPGYDHVAYQGTLADGKFLSGGYSTGDLARDDAARAETNLYNDAMDTAHQEEANLGGDPIHQMGVMQTNEDLYAQSMMTGYREEARLDADPMYQQGVWQTNENQYNEATPTAPEGGGGDFSSGGTDGYSGDGEVF